MAAEIETFDWNATANTAWDDVQSGSVPPGVYKVMVRDIGKQINKKAGNPVYVVQLAIADGEYKDVILFHRFNLPTKDTDMSKLRFWKGQLDDFQAVMGVADDDRKTGVIDPKLWYGQTCWAKTKEDEYEGKSQTRITQFFADDPAAAA